MKSILYMLAGISLFLLAWQVLAAIVNRSIIPAPAETLLLLLKLLFSREIVEAVWQTAWKACLALILVMMAGIPLGFGLGLCEPAYGVFRPLLMIIQTIPVISWLSLVIFAWGVGWKGPIFITFLALLPISVLTTVSGVHSMEKDLLEMAHLYRVPQQKVARDIYLGALLPFVNAVMNVCIGQVWKVILVSEYLCGGSGLGVKILMARMNVDFPMTWALTLIAVILGIIGEQLIKIVSERITRWWAFA